MFNLKKLLAGVLGAAMVMTSMTALAEDTRDDTINTDTPVSLTIHKYRMDDINDATTAGTGESTDEPAEGAEALDGVEFKVYKVADISQVQDADGNWQIQYNTLSGFQSLLDTTIEAGSSPNITETELSGITPTHTEVTGSTADGEDNAEGVAYFSSSELDGQGLYLVVEGSAPDVVTQKTAPFYVSLPMTDAAGDGWLYDVYAYPKNGTTTGSVTLYKYGKTGNAAASGVTGAQFVVQKYDSTTEKWVTCKTNDNGGSIGDKGVLTMESTSIKVEGLSQGTYRFVEIAAPDDAYIMDGSAVYEFKMTAEGKVTDLNNEELSNGISVTNYKPEVEKKVAQKGTTYTYGDAADYSVGDTVPFKVTATIPENVNKLTHYVLVDTMDDGLINPTNYVVKFYKDDTEVTISSITATFTNTSNPAGWKLDLSNDVDKLVDANGALLADTVEVTFNATLTADAVTGDVGNHNTVGLEYTNKIYPSTDDGNPNEPDDGEPSEETRTITDKVVVYTFGLELVKTFQGGDASETVFAKFDLYREATNTDTDTVALKVGSTTVNVVKVGSYQTDAEGKITINTSGSGDNDKAFSNGTYYFVETETADGYNLLSEPVAVTVQYYYIQTFQTTTTVTKYDANGNIIGEPEVTTTGTDATTYYTDADNEVTTTVTTKKVDVVNKKGFTLPSTGGMGSIIFIVGGIALAMAGLLIILASNKKAAAK